MFVNFAFFAGAFQLIFGIVFAVIVIISIVAAVKHTKNVSDIGKQAGRTFKDITTSIENALTNKEQSETTSQPEKKEEYLTCSYCGNRVSASKNKCDSCGARLNK